MSLSKPKVPIQSTAGAVPITNVKGDVAMEKVKVSRYVSGKRPDYAPDSSGSDEEVEFGLQRPGRGSTLPTSNTNAEREDRRLRRLQERLQDDSEEEEDRVLRRRRPHEPEVLGRSSSEEEEEESSEDDREREWRIRRGIEEEESSEGEELDEDEIERRRALLRKKALQHKEEEVMDVEEEKEEGSEEESSEYEEYTDSEEEETGPRLKPVFVRKKDRITIQEKEREERRQKELEQEVQRLAEERRRNTLKMVAQELKKELAEEKENTAEGLEINTDDDNDEEEYEAWKVRELKRMKRDRERKEVLDKDKFEVERLRNMTEEERRQEAKMNPKIITNKAAKGKYKFLQKYYHRGAFFLDNEDTVLKRDFSEATLEDHFDKTVLPKVMQVKNFGRSGRTKYTHLVDQDTTQFESPWLADTAMNLKFHTDRGGGMKQAFDRPSTTKKRK